MNVEEDLAFLICCKPKFPINHQLQALSSIFAILYSTFDAPLCHTNIMGGRTIISLFIAAIVASLGVGFFGGANYTKRHNPTKTTTTASVTPDVSPTATVDTSATPDASASPTDGQTYTVKKGDTLFSIGKQYNLTWTALAAANDLKETSLLKEGMVIKIPTQTEAATVQSHDVKITADAEETQTLKDAQAAANAGTNQLSYRLVPAQVVQKSLLLSRFQFTPSDLYVEKSKDVTKGESVVEVTHAGKLYTVYLNQPLDKGDKGVWSPYRVTY